MTRDYAWLLRGRHLDKGLGPWGHLVGVSQITPARSACHCRKRMLQSSRMWRLPGGTKGTEQHASRVQAALACFSNCNIELQNVDRLTVLAVNKNGRRNVLGGEQLPFRASWNTYTQCRALRPLARAGPCPATQYRWSRFSAWCFTWCGLSSSSLGCSLSPNLQNATRPRLLRTIWLVVLLFWCFYVIAAAVETGLMIVGFQGGIHCKLPAEGTVHCCRSTGQVTEHCRGPSGDL